MFEYGYRIIVSLVVINCICCINGVVVDFNATSVCELVPNGTFIRDPLSCTNYFECINGEDKSASCSKGFYFDKDNQKCVNQTTFNCYYLGMDPCINVPSQKFISDPESCSGYYYCKNGVGSKGFCSPQLNYNPDNGKCVPTTDYQCKIKPFDPNAYCTVIPSGVFFANPDNCQSYAYCKDDVQINGSCPMDFYFNGKNMKCDYKANVECKNDENHPLNGGQCEVLGTFVSDNATCSGYYYCDKSDTNNFQLYWGKCKFGRFFSEINGGVCVDRTQIKCLYDRCDGMGINQTEQADDPLGNCKDYLICSNGKTTSKGTCNEENPYFDEVNQMCTSNIINYPACAA